MKTTIKAINGYYYDVEFDWDDIYNTNVKKEEQFNKLDMENISRVTLDDHAIHLEIDEVYFTINLDSTIMELSPEYETENLEKMGNPPIVSVITEDEPREMWRQINEITDSVAMNDDPDMCHFIVGSDMFYIDEVGAVDEVMGIVQKWAK